MTRKKASVFPVLFVIFLVIMIQQCDDEEPGGGPRDLSPYVPAVAEKPGAAVAILVDTSGSMKEQVPGDTAPKAVVAEMALSKMLAATDAFLEKHPDYPVKVAVLSFSGEARTLLPVQLYDRQAVRSALAKLPEPDGMTAIGRGMEAAVQELYRSGAFRKYMIVLTDGENTAGIGPNVMAHEIHRRSEGSIPMYFIAFDTSPATFGFLEEVGGDVVGAGNAAQLEEVLRSVYEGRILAEALPEED